MCLGKFFTRAVTACGVTENGPHRGRDVGGRRPPSDPRGAAAAGAHLQDLHLEAAVGGGPVGHLQRLHEGLGELLHHRQDQHLGRTLGPGDKVSAGATAAGGTAPGQRALLRSEVLSWVRPSHRGVAPTSLARPLTVASRSHRTGPALPDHPWPQWPVSAASCFSRGWRRDWGRDEVLEETGLPHIPGNHPRRSAPPTRRILCSVCRSDNGRRHATFSSSSMLQTMCAQVVKISTARERVRMPYTWGTEACGYGTGGLTVRKPSTAGLLAPVETVVEWHHHPAWRPCLTVREPQPRAPGVCLWEER